MNDSQQTLESMNQAIWYNQWTLKKFAKYLRGDILEVGCGIGNFTNALTSYGRVFAMDIDKNYINKTKLLLSEGQVGLGDIERGKYFFDSQTFDSIVCLNVLEHIENDERALTNLLKLLKPDGTLILLIPAHPFLYGAIDKSIGHFRRYTKKELIQEMEKIGFKIIQSRRINLLGAIGWFISGKVLNESRVEDKKIKIFNLLAPLFLTFEDIIEPIIGTSILVIAKR